MESNWYAIVQEDTGQLLSTGSVIASVLPLGVIAIPINGPPSPNEMWDEKSTRFIPRPPPKTTDNSALMLESLSDEHREAVFNLVKKLMRESELGDVS